MNLSATYLTEREAIRVIRMEGSRRALVSIRQADQRTLELYPFLKEAWRFVESKPYVDNWHIGALCEHWQAVIDNQIRHLIVNIPPRHTKSLTYSVIAPAWTWAEASPSIQFLRTSYAERLSVRDNRLCRQIIQGPWYQERYGHKFRITSDQNEKIRFDNDQNGYQIATSFGGTTTGEGGDIILIDDPHNLKHIYSEAIRGNDIEVWDRVYSSRLNDEKTGHYIIIMQRAHKLDLTGHLQDDPDFTLLKLPMEFVPEKKCFTSIGWEDPRTERGELLNSGRFSRENNEKRKSGSSRMNSRDYSAQYQQEPVEPGGNIFKAIWWRFWYPVSWKEPPTPVTVHDEDGSIVELPQAPLPFAMTDHLQSWDMAFKDHAANSRVAGGAWARAGANKYMIDQVCDHMSFTVTLKNVEAFSRKHPKTVLKLIEDKANGPAIISSLRDKIPGLVAVQPQGSKTSRAHAETAQFEAGNVWIPHPMVYPWVGEYMSEMEAFANDDDPSDQVDQTTQALMRLRTSSGVDQEYVIHKN